MPIEDIKEVDENKENSSVMGNSSHNSSNEKSYKNIILDQEGQDKVIEDNLNNTKKSSKKSTVKIQIKRHDSQKSSLISNQTS